MVRPSINVVEKLFRKFTYFFLYEFAEDDMAEITAMNEQLTQSQNQFKVLKANVVMKTRLLEEIKIQCSQIEKDLEDIRQSR